MKSNHQWAVLSALLITCSSISFPVFAAGEPMSKSESQQTVEDMTPRGQYNISKKEDNAAYKDAVTACKSMKEGDKSACMKEAQTNFHNDMAQAKQTLDSQTSTGSSK
jgi:hypothetical protein